MDSGSFAQLEIGILSEYGTHSLFSKNSYILTKQLPRHHSKPSAAAAAAIVWPVWDPQGGVPPTEPVLSFTISKQMLHFDFIQIKTDKKKRLRDNNI